MKNLHSPFYRIAIALVAVMVFLVFFNGYKEEGPSRKKFKKLPETVEDLTVEAPVQQSEDPIKDVAREGRIKEWVGFWGRCLPGFTLKDLEDMGSASLDDESVESQKVEEAMASPARSFFKRSPSGKWLIDPYWGRLTYKKEQDGWQPYIELPCGALVVDKKSGKSRIALSCTMYEGLDDAIWYGQNKVAVLGHESVTRQMSVECESVESCTAPAIWFLDLDRGTQHSYRGKIIKREDCQLDSYIKQKLPEFFGKK